MTIAAATLLACAGAEPAAQETPAPAAQEPAEAPEPVEADPVVEAEDEVTDPSTEPAGLSARLTLDHPVIPAMTSPSRNEQARLDMTLHVLGPAGTTVTMVVPMAFELEWRLTASDGTRWEPVFYPPPVPRPGGPPTTTVTIPENGEVRVGTVHGISGFRRPGATSFQDGLPAGRYEVAVGSINIGGVQHDAPPMTLTVR